MPNHIGPADTFDAYFRDHFSEHPRVKAMSRLLDKFPTEGNLLRWHDAAARGFGPRAIAALFKIDEGTAKFYLDNVSVEWRK